MKEWIKKKRGYVPKAYGKRGHNLLVYAKEQEKLK